MKDLSWLPEESCWTIFNQKLHHLHDLFMGVGAGLEARIKNSPNISQLNLCGSSSLVTSTRITTLGK